MRKIECFIKTILNYIIHLTPISGHDYLLMYENRDIQVLYCKNCGDISLSWTNEVLMKKFYKFVEQNNNRENL